MASEPSEFGDEAAGDELRGVSAMLKGVAMLWADECIAGHRRSDGTQDGAMNSEGSEGKYSRLAFFDLCIFVTASEGEELIVDIIGRHGEVSGERFAVVSGV